MSQFPSTRGSRVTHVLVADDDPFNVRLLRELCMSVGYRVSEATTGTLVLEMVRRDRPDLVLLDVAMPSLDGLATLAAMKADETLAEIPVILVTGTSESLDSAEGIDRGAADFVTKPFRVFEIQQRIRNALRHRAPPGSRRDRPSDPGVDPLTQAGSTHELVARLEYEFARARRYGEALTCLVVRLANHADIADAIGIDGADGALVQLSSALRAAVRNIDHVFRSDLEEFTLLLPRTGETGAAALAQRITDRSGDGSLWGRSLRPRPEIQLAHATFPAASVQTGEELRLTALDRIGGDGP